MASQAVQQLLEQGQRSGLFTAVAAQELVGQATPERELTVDEVATRLVEKKLVTAYQAEQLRAGRGDQCIVAGRYCILEELGAGGMGTVYKAQDTKFDRLVALKVLPPHLVNDRGAVARFQREAKALAKVSHPAIVQAHDTGDDGGRQFLVMEYVEGKNLGRVVKEQGHISPTLAADYIYQASLGLQHAHDKGLVHRDLKPSNLLLTPDRQVKILDLGLARFLQDQLGEAGLTREGTGLGTPDYMAPEQFGDARHVDRRADIYSLGCTLYHLLTGKVPFPGSSLTEKAKAHEDQEPPPVEERCPEAPAGLVLVVQRLIAKRPADRFQTAGEVAEALAPYVASSGPLSHLRRTTSWQGSQLSFTVPRPPRHHRRRRWALAGVTSVLVLALAIYFGSGFFGGAGTSGNGSPARPEVVTIPNGFTVAKDGTGQFTTIGEALKAVKLGQSIRVLDGGIYEEVVEISHLGQHDGITLEAAQKATIKAPATAPVALVVQNVPNVTVRGFRLELGEGQTQYLTAIIKKCPGVAFDGLDLASSRRINTCAITVESIEVSKDEPPVTVRNCTIRGFDHGIRVEGLVRGRPDRCRGVVIHKNKMFSCGIGIWTGGLINDVHIAANRVWDCGVNCIELGELAEGSSGILVANNTVKSVQGCLVIKQPRGGLQRIELRSNLFLAERGPDLAFTGTDQRVLAGWGIANNWRQVQPPGAGDPAWIPTTEDRVGPVTLRSLDPVSPDFLRPATDSPLATDGAGKDDPTLPTYIGAVPPEGVAPWDWHQTWDARQKRAP